MREVYNLRDFEVTARPTVMNVTLEEGYVMNSEDFCDHIMVERMGGVECPKPYKHNHYAITHQSLTVCDPPSY